MLPVSSVTAERRRIWAALQVDENVLPMGKSFTKGYLCLFLSSVTNSSSVCFFLIFILGFGGVRMKHTFSSMQVTHK